MCNVRQRDEQPIIKIVGCRCIRLEYRTYRPSVGSLCPAVAKVKLWLMMMGSRLFFIQEDWIPKLTESRNIQTTEGKRWRYDDDKWLLTPFDE